MPQQAENHSANHGILSHPHGDADSLRPDSEKKGTFSKVAWKLQEMVGHRRIARSHAVVRKKLASMQDLDESNKPLLDECIQYNAGVMEALKQYIEASKMYSGSVQQPWVNLLEEVEGVQKNLIRKRGESFGEQASL